MGKNTGDLRRTRLCCSGSERRRICTPKWGHSAFSFWFWVVGDHPSALMSHQSVTSVKAVVARGAVAACNGAATRSGRPTHRHTTHNGRLSRTIGHRAANISPHRWGGGRIPHTPEQHRHLTRQRSLDVAGALHSVLSRLFNGGVRPRAAPSRSRRETSEPHAMRACAMAPLAPCLRQID